MNTTEQVEMIQRKNLQERLETLEAFADIMSRIFHHGDMIIETPNERTAVGILCDLGYYPTTEDKIVDRPDHEDLRQKYKSFRIPKP